MRVVGWLLLVCVGFPISGAITYLFCPFVLGFWEGLAQGLTGASLSIDTRLWTNFVILAVWGLLARWYYLRGRQAKAPA